MTQAAQSVVLIDFQTQHKRRVLFFYYFLIGVADQFWIAQRQLPAQTLNLGSSRYPKEHQIVTEIKLFPHFSRKNGNILQGIKTIVGDNAAYFPESYKWWSKTQQVTL